MFAYIAFGALLVAAVSAEPPRAQLNSRFSKQFQQVDSAPVQPSQFQQLPGQFILLQRLQSVPQLAVQPQQGQERINPQERAEPRTTTEAAARNVTDVEELQPGKAAEDKERSEKLTQGKGEEGVYYIYHPNGLLQKVLYATNDDAENMAFSAKLRYQNVEPINGPIYTYDPETFVFKRI